MGTWGIRTFDNDGTSDWLYDLEEAVGTSLLEQALNAEGSEYLEAPDGEIILAAAEIILGIKDKPRSNLPDNAIEWINSHKNLDVSKLVTKAIFLIDRVLGENSELNELWAENEENYPDWKSDVMELRKLLAS